ncbi:hypothetical protein EV384_0902 [Micromonospora kangleipakensis]|uniref:Uncharacterized protein n=1 Tax=Micromonospora kangleipakensis TaxID=1077942 RepID=A0A4Q8B656_9ACTN|nr:hypothetical protein [Micromonospora kangleipakensis]RZU72531.1 hypothetical protein EV384_0902 [Micromonospora kangleipakensis]
MPVQRTVHPAHCASGHSSALSDARLLSALATLRDALAPGEALNLPAVLDHTALLACLSVLGTNSTPTTVRAPRGSYLPPRCNFAGYCVMCGHQACQSPACIAEFAQTAWAVCNQCHGAGADPASSLPCSCWGGLTQVDTELPVAVAR